MKKPLVLDKTVLRRVKDYFKLLKFVTPQKANLVLASIFMAISTIFDGVSLGMLVPILDRVLTPGKIIAPRGLPPFLSGFVAKLNSLPPLVILKGMLIVIPTLIIVKGVFFFFQSYLMNVVAQAAMREVKDRLYAKLQDLSLDFYSKKRAGELISRQRYR